MDVSNSIPINKNILKGKEIRNRVVNRYLTESGSGPIQVRVPHSPQARNCIAEQRAVALDEWRSSRTAVSMAGLDCQYDTAPRQVQCTMCCR